MNHKIDTKPGEKGSNLGTFAAWYARSFWAHKGDFGAARKAWKAHQAKRIDVVKLVERAELARAGRVLVTPASSRAPRVLTFVLQGAYGHGWEDLTSEPSRLEINARLREYRENEGGTYRVVARRGSR